MKKFSFICSITCAFLAFIISLSACGTTNNESSYNSSPNNSSVEEPEKVETNCTIKATSYDGINSLNSESEISTYEGEVATNLPVENGVMVSPFYTLTINGEDVPVYATRSANGTHSFAYVDVKKVDDSKAFLLQLQLKATNLSTVFNVRQGKAVTVAVLPESTGVKAVVNQEEKTVTAEISEYGSYSFAFNISHKEAVTIMIKPEENTATLFGDKKINYIQPDNYVGDKANDLLFTNESEVYYFKAGRYQIDGIKIPANSVLYLERGCYLQVMPGNQGYPLSASSANGIVVAGRGLIDYSACCGGEVPEGYYNNKNGLNFSRCDNIDISGLTVINSQTWTLCLNDCEGVQINDLLFFAYRVYADGVMLSDCKNAIVENCFIRTGDDAFETKSTTSTGYTDNVLFRYNAAWTDKAVAYGCIYESNQDTRNVHFENNSVGFALGTWSNHLGCCVIQMGNRKGAVMEDIYFKDMEIYYSNNPAILNVYIGGSGGRGEGYGNVKNIYFENVTARRNYGAYLNVRTYDSENCFIGALYLDNIVSNGEQLTKDNYKTEGYILDNVTGGYSFRKYFHLNSLMEEEE